MQTNVEFYRQSEKLLAKFEEISTPENVSEIKPLSTSIQINCKCGCQMVEHFSVAENKSHYQRYFVQLCNKHELSEMELK